jgi:acetylornithine deacetylase/succinyl-diaminopimelate desuccinylase-like protein
MTRTAAIQSAERYFDTQAFHTDLARRVAIATESQNPDRKPELHTYLTGELTTALVAMGFTCSVHESPVGKSPFMIATRIEDAGLPTVLSYGHGDVIRGLEPQWHGGQQGPAHHQYRRIAGSAGNARQARFQRQAAD